MNVVPHGQIYHQSYHSNLAGENRDFYDYTPPDYDTSESLFIGLKDLDRLDYLGAFSSVAMKGQNAAMFPNLDSSTAPKIRVF
jgi:hypothetical protein